MVRTDERQATFADFEVPDPGRIRKVHAWLAAHGHLDASRPLSVLEIGYATGGLLDRLDAGDIRKVAVDMNERTVGRGITFIRHDCNEDFDFAERASFDVVFAGEIIEHIFDDKRFLQQIHRVLRPGAFFAGSDSVWSPAFALVHLFDTLVPVDPDTLAGRLEAVGFKEISVQRAGGSFSFRARRLN